MSHGSACVLHGFVESVAAPPIDEQEGTPDGSHTQNLRRHFAGDRRNARGRQGRRRIGSGRSWPTMISASKPEAQVTTEKSG